ncbi:MAG: hypothetical protein ACREHD_05125, partial [Pirellulales bacterium]
GGARGRLYQKYRCMPARVGVSDRSVQGVCFDSSVSTLAASYSHSGFSDRGKARGHRPPEWFTF